MVRIEELFELSDSQVDDLLALMNELSPRARMDAGQLRRVAQSSFSHLFAMMNTEGHVIGTASLCVCDSPTGRKAHVEDVVVLSSYRGKGLGRSLMEHLIDYARRELTPSDLYLTSKPSRVAANGLYRALGFQQKETNVYKMHVGD